MDRAEVEYYAIGYTHSMATVLLIEDILIESKFGFFAEGTSMSGYELYVERSSIAAGVEKIRRSPKVHIEGHKIEFYDQATPTRDNTRYGRLLKHINRANGS